MYSLYSEIYVLFSSSINVSTTDFYYKLMLLFPGNLLFYIFLSFSLFPISQSFISCTLPLLLPFYYLSHFPSLKCLLKTQDLRFLCRVNVDFISPSISLTLILSKPAEWMAKPTFAELEIKTYEMPLNINRSVLTILPACHIFVSRFVMLKHRKFFSLKIGIEQNTFHWFRSKFGKLVDVVTLMTSIYLR